jgi:hypothetical protein
MNAANKQLTVQANNQRSNAYETTNYNNTIIGTVCIKHTAKIEVYSEIVLISHLPSQITSISETSERD